ncbi:MAG: hypothetical protein ACKVOH_04270 [Chlamydiales bacterium]
MEENKIIQFVQKHWVKFVMGGVVFVTLLLWAERLFHKSQGSAKQDYLLANQILERYRRGSPIELESLLSAEGIVLRHPHLRPQYEAMLAHCFFYQSDLEKGMDYAYSSLARVEKELEPSYQRFTEISLLIANEEYAPAYAAATELEKSLQGEKTYCRALNLLRLCFLADKVEGGMAPWETLQAHPLYAALVPLFNEGEVGLQDYTHSTSRFGMSAARKSRD